MKKTAALSQNLEALRVIKPCPQKWDEMTGNNQKRFCEHCNLHVHNLSALSPRKIHQLAESPGRRCVAYVTKPDGAIRTRSFFDSLKNPATKTVRLAASLLALVFPFSFISCATKNTQASSHVTQPSTVSKQNMMTRGEAMTLGDPVVLPEPAPAQPPMIMGTPVVPSPTSSSKASSK